MDDSHPHPGPVKALRNLQERFDELAGGLGAIQRAWPEVVGPQAGRCTFPARLEGGELRVRCSSASWASELLGLSGEILERLEQRLGSDAPTRLKPYTGSVPTARSAGPSTPAGPTPKATPPPLRGDELNRATADLQALPPGPLRDSVARALAASRRQPR